MDTDFEFEVADLPAERWLRGMEPALGGIGQAPSSATATK